jgi:hypothetical protein
MEEQLTSLVLGNSRSSLLVYYSGTLSRSSGLMVGRWLCETNGAMAHRRKPLK